MLQFSNFCFFLFFFSFFQTRPVSFKLSSAWLWVILELGNLLVCLQLSDWGTASWMRSEISSRCLSPAVSVLWGPKNHHSCLSVSPCSEYSYYPTISLRLSHPPFSTRSPFVILLSRRAQSGRWSSFGKRAWFTESHLVLVIFFFTYVLFINFIIDIK